MATTTRASLTVTVRCDNCQRTYEVPLHLQPAPVSRPGYADYQLTVQPPDHVLLCAWASQHHGPFTPG